MISVLFLLFSFAHAFSAYAADGGPRGVKRKKPEISLRWQAHLNEYYDREELKRSHSDVIIGYQGARMIDNYIERGLPVVIATAVLHIPSQAGSDQAEALAAHSRERHQTLVTRRVVEHNIPMGLDQIAQGNIAQGMLYLDCARKSIEGDNQDKEGLVAWAQELQQQHQAQDQQ